MQAQRDMDVKLLQFNDAVEKSQKKLAGIEKQLETIESVGDLELGVEGN